MQKISPNEKLKQVAEVLVQIVEDTSVPRNIRRAATEARDILLKEDQSPALRASTVITILDDMANDPNIPVHARTLVWNVASELEPIAVEK
ncbi:MAG: UPF0147 family protein [Euryarchaeota archaeon]|nr:UPF0147 family protein [Euryarchaeota archaeon]